MLWRKTLTELLVEFIFLNFWNDCGEEIDDFETETLCSIFQEVK